MNLQPVRDLSCSTLRVCRTRTAHFAYYSRTIRTGLEQLEQDEISLKQSYSGGLEQLDEKRPVSGSVFEACCSNDFRTGQKEAKRPFETSTLPAFPSSPGRASRTGLYIPSGAGLHMGRIWAGGPGLSFFSFVLGFLAFRSLGVFYV
jgi:hypothetical protein